MVRGDRLLDLGLDLSVGDAERVLAVVAPARGERVAVEVRAAEGRAVGDVPLPGILVVLLHHGVDVVRAAARCRDVCEELVDRRLVRRAREQGGDTAVEAVRLRLRGARREVGSLRVVGDPVDVVMRRSCSADGRRGPAADESSGSEKGNEQRLHAARASPFSKRRHSRWFGIRPARLHPSTGLAAGADLPERYFCAERAAARRPSLRTAASKFAAAAPIVPPCVCSARTCCARYAVWLSM